LDETISTAPLTAWGTVVPDQAGIAVFAMIRPKTAAAMLFLKLFIITPSEIPFFKT
jgi:hypothetical protein